MGKVKIKYVLLFVIALINGYTFSQNGKDPQDYGVWENIYNGDISNDGKWFYFTSQYQEHPDTLTVMETSGEKKYKIANGNEGLFTKDNRFFTVYSQHSQIQIIDLKKDSIIHINNIRSRYFSFDERFLILLKNGEKNSELLIKHLGIGTEILIPQVLEFKINPTKNEIAIILEDKGEFSVRIIDLNSYTSETIQENSDFPYKNLVWSADGSQLAFMELAGDGVIVNSKIFSCVGRECKELALGKIKKISTQKLADDFLDISTHGDFVYFKCSKENTADTLYSKDIQVWDTADKWIYPMRKINNLLEPQPALWSWMPFKDKIDPITDTLQTKIIKVNADFILKYDELSYEPEYKFIADVDIYLNNLNTGKSLLLFEKQNPNEIFISPTGAYIVYFHNEDWWLYNLNQQSFINLTESLSVPFLARQSDRADRLEPFTRRVKWTTDGTAILVCDEFDVWLLGLDGKIKSRLTKGREIQRNYSLFIDFANPKKIDQNLVDLQDGLLIKAEDATSNTGYFLWEDDNLKELSFGPFLMDEIKWDPAMRYITFRLQSYETPQKICFYDRNSDILKTVFESNRKRTLTEWGHPVLLSFKMKNGKSSKACLIYPVDYNPEKKYPMIVKIYEKESKKINEFIPISWYSSTGFNPAHYALDGYFVLMPDITYTIGNVGVSANEYVNESVDFVLQKVNIAKNKIGLIGHSFGGYEAAFIATQTDRYAAIVVGAAVTDIVTYYHTINWISGQEQMFRFEDYQMRMGKSYFDLKKGYSKNSPFHHVENVSTPLLLWSGGNDLHVDYNQSIRFYLALRRLRKNAKLLLFENEEHVILDYMKKKYLSQSIKKMFDQHCKLLDQGVI